jgi:hypothetical protein
MRKKLRETNVRLAHMRTQGGKAMMEYVRRHLQGHLQYYGVSGNSRSLRQYVHKIRRILFKWINRRSQRRSTTWATFDKTVARYIPPVRIVHNLYPSPR